MPPGSAAIPALELSPLRIAVFDQLAQAPVLDAPGVPLGELEEVGEPLLVHQIEEPAVPGNAPAIELQRRGVERQRKHVIGVAGGVMHGQDRAHRQPAHDDVVAGLLQAVVLLLHGGAPVLPAGRLELVGGAAMARQLRHVHGVAGASQTLRHEAHLHRRPAEAVDQEEAQPPSGKAQASIGNFRCGHAYRPRLIICLRFVSARIGEAGNRLDIVGLQPGGEVRLRLVEIRECAVRQPTGPAEARERALGDDEIGARRHAEVGPAIADGDGLARRTARCRASTCSWRCRRGTWAANGESPGASGRRPATRACWRRTVWEARRPPGPRARRDRSRRKPPSPRCPGSSRTSGTRETPDRCEPRRSRASTSSGVARSSST